MGIHIPATLSFGVVFEEPNIPRFPWGEDGSFFYSRRHPDCPVTEIPVYFDDQQEKRVIIALKSSVVEANWRGGDQDPVEAKMEWDPAELEAAKAFCLMHHIPFEEPKWWLSVCLIGSL